MPERSGLGLQSCGHLVSSPQSRGTAVPSDPSVVPAYTVSGRQSLLERQRLKLLGMTVRSPHPKRVKQACF